MATGIAAHSSFNILNLTDADLYSGRIELYTASQQQLTLKFFSQVDQFSPLFMVQFATVHYVDLPASWQGADIHTASEQNCWEMLTQVLGPSVAKPDPAVKSELLEAFRLFTIHIRQTDYRIIAAKTIELVAP